MTSKRHLKNPISANAPHKKIDLSVSPNEEHFSFNFSYLTKDENHNFHYYKQTSQVGEFSKRLFNTIDKISLINTKNFSTCGYFSDSMPFKELKVNYRSALNIDQDEKVFSVSLSSKKHERMIIYKSSHFENKNILYVIMFDYNFSAYNHG